METGFFLIPITLFIFLVTIFLFNQYKRCPLGKLLVVYGKIEGDEPVKILDRGGTFVVPIIQDCGYLSLEAMELEIELKNIHLLDKKELSLIVYFVFGISKRYANNAVQRLFGLQNQEIISIAKNIILGKLNYIESEKIEDNYYDKRVKELIDNDINKELNKTGLEIISRNIKNLVINDKGI